MEYDDDDFRALNPMPDDIRIKAGDADGEVPSECLDSITRGVKANVFAKILQYGMEFWPEKIAQLACTKGIVSHIKHFEDDGHLCWIIVQRLLWTTRNVFKYSNYILMVGAASIVEEGGQRFAVFPNTTFTYAGETKPEDMNNNRYPFRIVYFWGMDSNVFAIAKVIEKVGDTLETDDNDVVSPIQGTFDLQHFRNCYDFLNHFIKAKTPKPALAYFGPAALRTNVKKNTFMFPFGVHLNVEGMLKSLLKESGYATLNEICEKDKVQLESRFRNEQCEEIIQEIMKRLPGVQGSKPKQQNKKRKATVRDEEEDEYSDEEQEPELEVCQFYDGAQIDDETLLLSFTEIVNSHACDMELRAGGSAPMNPDQKVFKEIEFDEDSMAWHLKKLPEAKKEKITKTVKQGFPALFKHFFLKFEYFSSIIDRRSLSQVIWSPSITLEKQAKQNLQLLVAVMDEQASNFGKRATMFASVCAYNQKEFLRYALDTLTNQDQDTILEHLIATLGIFDVEDQQKIRNESQEPFFFNLMHRFLGRLVYSAVEEMQTLSQRMKWKYDHLTPRVKPVEHFAVMEGDYVSRQSEENKAMYETLNGLTHRLTTRTLPLFFNGRQFLVGIKFGTGPHSDGTPEVFRPLFPYEKVFEEDAALGLKDFKMIEAEKHRGRDFVFKFAQTYIQNTKYGGVPFKTLLQQFLTEIVHNIMTGFISKSATVYGLPDDVQAFLDDHPFDRSFFRANDYPGHEKECIRFFTGLGKLASVQDKIATKDPISNAIAFCALFATYSPSNEKDKMVCKRIAPLVELGAVFQPNPRFLYISGVDGGNKPGEDFLAMP